jgi:hypothetical protein
MDTIATALEYENLLRLHQQDVPEYVSKITVS